MNYLSNNGQGGGNGGSGRWAVAMGLMLLVLLVRPELEKIGRVRIVVVLIDCVVGLGFSPCDDEVP
ncbi:MAG: hypothetical protein II180_02250, partial [Proteobacteria bacterium]|nr:hypothetical protein [Pseudomonadota bacterium]